jgi:[ribosomal protein S18]-alanine N-acetyltransferase
VTAVTGAALRRMRWWDVEAVALLERELFAHDAWSVEQFWNELAHVPQSRWYAVHEDEHGIDGYAGLSAVPPEADVQTIAVATRSQGSGVGRQLLDGLIAEARRRGCAQVFLEVRVDNEPAIALYERRGFTREARRSDYYGPGLDALVMRLRLATDVEEAP